MKTPLKATLYIRKQDGLWADLRIVNQGDKAVEILQPGSFPPYNGWEHSYEAYQVAALQSFHILRITILDENQEELSQQEIITMADHVFRQIALEPGQELSLSIPLHEFYRLDSGVRYTIVIQYGRDQIKAQVKTTFEVD
jgi:hypothetical protein